MSDIFSPSLGGMNVMRPASADTGLIKSRAVLNAEKDRSFAQKLQEVQEKAEALNTNKTPEQDRKLREVCQEMEAVFLNMLLGQMRDTVPERTLFPMSSGEKMMQSMLDVELTRQMAKNGGMGLGEMLYKQLSNPGLKKIPDASPTP
jgi:flagellar protein FlgJ